MHTQKGNKPLAARGQRYGHWTILENQPILQNNKRKWLCRCDCGTERYVQENNLLYGYTTSCGCLRKEKAAAAISPDLTGRIFGDLTVLEKTKPKKLRSGVWWHCICACGEECDVPGTLLTTGRKNRCSGRAHIRNYNYNDITGQKFGLLTALYPSKRFDKSGSVIWHCQCECGNETDVSYNNLMYTNRKSCGCQRQIHNQKLPELLTHIDGTSIDLIRSKRLPANNTTGHKGVYLTKGKYIAKIVFQQKKYHLGTYVNLDDAIQARKEAEEILFDAVVAHYDQWKALADTDPAWAKENPVQVIVEQKIDKSLSVTLFPKIKSQKPRDEE